ncbi:MAG: capsule assembly Wzi family protein [Bacteroidota bacterium]
MKKTPSRTANLKFIQRLIVLLFWMSSTSATFCQVTDFQLNHPAYFFTEMEDIRQKNSTSTTLKPYSREIVAETFIDSSNSYLSLEARRFTDDSTRSKKPILKKLYSYPADLFYYQDKSLTLHLNPYFQFSYGVTNDAINSTFVNTRGIEVRGNFNERIAFYSVVSENQARFPDFVNDVRDSTLAHPYEGFWKSFNDTGIDFLRAQGYIDFGITKSISAQFGFGKHFIGNGYRSLILSDFSNNYPYLRINTSTKIFDYTNIFGELLGDLRGNADGLFGTGAFSTKYMALHHLNIKIRPNLHIGIFESVMYGDTTGGLKVSYLNPIIFYRAIEQQNGSEDNAFLGLDFKWNFLQKFSLYGQLSIDEMIFSEVFSQNGWWGNKQGYQLGLKYVDAFSVKNLMLQAEFNKVRPYMYAHEDAFTSYSHYNSALAHPLGANFSEIFARAIYQIGERWTVEGNLLFARYGNDLGNVNYGRDILKDYIIRVPNENGSGSREFGNDHLQGNLTTLTMGFGRITYMPRHNLFIDLEGTWRREKDESDRIDLSTSWIGASVRFNVQRNSYLF